VVAAVDRVCAAERMSACVSLAVLLLTADG
jgi:hypothetical protein